MVKISDIEASKGHGAWEGVIEQANELFVIYTETEHDDDQNRKTLFPQSLDS